jgi:hypothetical protein
MFASISFQNVNKISAHAYPELESTPFFIAFESTENDDSQYSRGEVCLHIEDATLALALVEAINRTVAEHKAKTSAPEAIVGSADGLH